MSKKDAFNYFDAFTSQAGFAQEITLNLKSALANGELGSRELLDALHTVENDADEVNHEIQSHLVSDFVVPLERSGMGLLAHTLDDVSDAVEEVAIRGYMFHCSVLEPEGPAMVDMLAEATAELKAAVEGLASLSRNRNEIHTHLMNVQNAESNCDRIFIDSVHALYGRTDISGEERRIAYALLESVEDAMDAAENAAERIESIIAENL